MFLDFIYFGDFEAFLSPKTVFSRLILTVNLRMLPPPVKPLRVRYGTGKPQNVGRPKTQALNTPPSQNHQTLRSSSLKLFRMCVKLHNTPVSLSNSVNSVQKHLECARRCKLREIGYRIANKSRTQFRLKGNVRKTSHLVVLRAPVGVARSRTRGP